MASYMLDTNICVYLMMNQPKEVAERFAKCYVGDVVMSAITYAELEYGVARSVDPEKEQRTLFNLIQFKILRSYLLIQMPVWLMVQFVWQHVTVSKIILIN